MLLCFALLRQSFWVCCKSWGSYCFPCKAAGRQGWLVRFHYGPPSDPPPRFQRPMPPLQVPDLIESGFRSASSRNCQLESPHGRTHQPPGPISSKPIWTSHLLRSGLRGRLERPHPGCLDPVRRLHAQSTNCSALSSSDLALQLLGRRLRGMGFGKGSFEVGFPGVRGQKRAGCPTRSSRMPEKHRFSASKAAWMHRIGRSCLDA